MTNPLTHLLWGYTISKNISKDKGLIILGLISSTVLDIDILPLPGFRHHGFVHTPIFIIIMSLLIYIISRSDGKFLIVFSNMFFHLVLDTLGTRAPVMWFYPITNTDYALGMVIPLSQLILIKVILLLVPLLYIHHCWKKRGENPLDLIEYSKERYGSKTTYAVLIIASIVIGIVIIYHYIFEYYLELT
jgi:hypothetical protein